MTSKTTKIKKTLICKYCHIQIAKDLEKLIEEETKKGNSYIECPNCNCLTWIKSI